VRPFQLFDHGVEACGNGELGLGILWDRFQGGCSSPAHERLALEWAGMSTASRASDRDTSMSMAPSEHRIPAGDRLRAHVRVEDIFHSRNPGPFYTSDPASPFYAPGLVADPAANLLNLRADVERGQLDVALYLNNVLDFQPTLLKRNKGNDLTTLYYATTFRPRTLGLAGTRRF
jgi:hypothetical protein